MGTTYNISYVANKEDQLKAPIDSLLKEINQQVSIYIPESDIVQFNQGKDWTIDEVSPKHFYTIFKKAKTIYQKTNGAFDPTVMPLVRYWGFGKNKKAVEEADAKEIAQLVQLVDFDGIQVHHLKESKVEGPDGEKEFGLDYLKFEKRNPSTQLDFGAIAKGYAVDAIGQFLIHNQIHNFLIEIGGELVAKGLSQRGTPWVTGISLPEVGASVNEIVAAILLKDKAVASSGNYRNFYEVKGEKYGHTINPKTGYPEKNELLSVLVVANDCMTADAYATGFMTMGLSAAFSLASAEKEIEAYFIYGDESGGMAIRYTSGMEELIVKQNSNKNQ